MIVGAPRPLSDSWCTTESPVRGKSMSIRVFKRGENKGGNLGGKHDARRIRYGYSVECLKGCLIEKIKTFSEKSVHILIR